MITLTDLGKSYGAQTLFRGASMQFHPGGRYGVVGANGSGKSSLLRMIAGEETPSDGAISLPRRARVGVLRQDHFRYDDVPILEVVMMGHAELWQAIEEKERLLERAAESFDADRYGELEDLVVRHDGYALEARAGRSSRG